jgi:hypothetical protein
MLHATPHTAVVLTTILLLRCSPRLLFRSLRQRFDLQLQPGDIIVTGSDGLWDNIFAEEAATIASKCRDKGETATTAAQVLCRWEPALL